MESFTKERLSQQEVLDARLCWPFNMIVSGPTGAGKSTFVSALIEKSKVLMNKPIHQCILFLGIKAAHADAYKNNPIPHTVVDDLMNRYGNDRKNFNKQFPKDVFGLIDREMKDKNLLLIFDDMMSELADCDLLVPLFTKLSSHCNVSSIFITQNLFYRGGNRSSKDNTTLYRNAQYIIIFDCALDKSILTQVAKRLEPARSGPLCKGMQQVCKDYRYILIDGHPSSPVDLKYRTDLFATVGKNLHYFRSFKFDHGGETFNL